MAAAACSQSARIVHTLESMTVITESVADDLQVRDNVSLNSGPKTAEWLSYAIPGLKAPMWLLTNLMMKCVAKSHLSRIDNFLRCPYRGTPPENVGFPREDIILYCYRHYVFRYNRCTQYRAKLIIIRMVSGSHGIVKGIRLSRSWAIRASKLQVKQTYMFSLLITRCYQS
jgi:hypothetical protein